MLAGDSSHQRTISRCEAPSLCCHSSSIKDSHLPRQARAQRTNNRANDRFGSQMRWWKGPSLLDSVCQLRAKPKMRQADGPPVVCFSRAMKIGGVGTVFVGMVLRGTLRPRDRAVIFPVRTRQVFSLTFVVFVPSLSWQNRCVQRFTRKLKNKTKTRRVCRGVLRR